MKNIFTGLKKAKLIYGGREVEVGVANPAVLEVMSSSLAVKIINAFRKPDYPSNVAQELGVSKQAVSFHVKRLVKAGVLKEVGKTEVKGGLARLYMADVSGIAVVFPKPRWRRRAKFLEMPPPLSTFLHPFIYDEKLNGLVVVGSPHPHGPFRAVAADGHYSFQLGLFLGRYVAFPDDFVVRLDVDVKSEKLHYNNMLLLGGPGTNIITAMVNSSLPICFNERNFWAGLSSPKQIYSSEFVGLVAKIPNPVEPSKTVIVLAGLRASGTKAAVIALTQNWQKLLTTYHGQESWAAVVEGLDLDGDGKIDSVEILETT